MYWRMRNRPKTLARPHDQGLIGVQPAKPREHDVERQGTVIKRHHHHRQEQGEDQVPPQNWYLAKANAAMLANQTAISVLVVATKTEFMKLRHSPP